MLVYIDENRRIIAYHDNISYDDALQYVSISSLWIDDVINLPDIPLGSTCEMYLNENNTILYKIVNIPPEEMTDTQLQMQKLNDIELAQLEESLKAESERQSLAQKQYDMELLLVELTLGGATV